MSEECKYCRGHGFIDDFFPMGDGFEYRSLCGWCKGTGKVQNSEQKVN